MAIVNKAVLEAGITPGDQVIEINGESVLKWRYAKVKDRLQNRHIGPMEVCFQVCL